MRRLILISAFCLLTVTGAAQSATQSQKAKLEKEIELLDRQLKENEKKSSSALNSLSLTRKKVSSSRKLVEESNREIKAIDEKIGAKEKDILSLQARIDTLSLYYGKLIRSAYINRDSRIWLMYILSSDNLGKSFRRIGYFKNLASNLNNQAKKLSEAKSSLQVEKEELQTMRKQADEMKTSRQKQLNKLKSAETENQKLVNQLQRNKAKYQKQLASKRKQMEALNREISKIMEKKVVKSTNPEDIKLSGEFAANKGKLPWPVDGSIVESFGQHYHPVYKNVKLPFNNGVNLATSKGAPVKAIFNGTVRQIIVMPGYNQCVLVQHGDYFTFYCKLGQVLVKAGDKVKVGQTLGNVETINGETELHFQLWEGKKPQNPEKWLR